MVMNDPLAAALSKLNNAQSASRKKEAVVVKSTKLVKAVLDILNKKGYVGSYELIENNGGNVLQVNILNTINKVGVIKPRFSFTNGVYQKVEKQYLPAKDFGLIIVSTSEGIMTLEDAKQKNIGGKLVAFCY
jgi:small subunit ribosomal protein S8